MTSGIIAFETLTRHLSELKNRAKIEYTKPNKARGMGRPPRLAPSLNSNLVAK